MQSHRTGWVCVGSRSVLLSFLFVLTAYGPALADPPECPEDTSTPPVSGTITGVNPAPDIIIDLKPCQTLSVTVETSDPHQWWGNTFQFQLFNTTNQVLYEQVWSSLSTSTKVFPITAYGWTHPYRGTRGAPGLPYKAVFRTTASPAGSANYTITITKLRRPSYNIGGSEFANAPVVTTDQTYRGSVHRLETGQYFKVNLAAGQSLSMSGSLFAGPVYSSLVKIFVHSSPTIVGNESPLFYTSVNNVKLFTTSTFTNTSGSAADFWVRIMVEQQMLHEFQVDFFIGQIPALKLFLDINDSGDPDHFTVPGDDESAQYIPGSRSNGTSVLPVATTDPRTPLQDYVQIIAAYVHPDGGRIVSPPGAGDVVFGLTEVTRLKGMAMNWGDDTGDDFAFPDGSTSKPFDLTTRTARISLRCYDYGGSVKVTAVRGAHNAFLKLPKDEGNNWIPDAGWKLPDGTPIADAGNNTDDDDFITAETSQQGDGLTRFEEYRGFVVEGQHVRTHPTQADLFIHSELPELLGDAIALPIKVWSVLDTEVHSDRSINFNYTSSVAGGDIPGHYVNPVRGTPNQYAIRIVDGGYNGFVTGNTTPIRPGPVVPSNILAINVFTESIRLVIPTTNDTTIPDTVDPEKTDQTIGHEVGHGVNLPDVAVAGQCPSPFFTVMVTEYLNPSATMNCPWSNIPHVYLAWKDFPSFTLK